MATLWDWWAQPSMSVVGDAGVGKSSLVVRWLKEDHFIDCYDPTIEDTHKITFNIDGKPVVVMALDAASREDNTTHLRRSQWPNVWIIVYDITNLQSLQSGIRYLEDLKADKRYKTSDYVAFIGNKLDLEADRKVPLEEAREMLKKHNVADVREVSCKDNKNVKETGERLARIAAERFNAGKEETSPTSSGCIIL